MLPEVITVQRGGRGLKLQLPGGDVFEIDASLLRAKCRCAACLNASRPAHPAIAGSAISIVELRQVGSTGLQAVFSDGHERGIYPWSYLNEIASMGDRVTCAG